MDVRRLVRGSVPWSDLETIGDEVRSRYELGVVRVEFLDADNWLSTPCVVNDTWFVKIISPQNALVHALFTGARNLGAFASSGDGFFEPLDGPFEMARHELAATRTLKRIGVNVPDPVESFQVDGYGVLVLEYLPAFETLEDQSAEELADWAPRLFESLWLMHDHQLAHGDLRGENVLIHDDELFFIDVTSVSEDGIENARAYDIASALATIAPAIGAREAVAAALEYYTMDELLDARELLDFVRLRPDHEFDATRVKGEIERRASRR